MGNNRLISLVIALTQLAGRAGRPRRVAQVVHAAVDGGEDAPADVAAPLVDDVVVGRGHVEAHRHPLGGRAEGVQGGSRK